jgi:hypothetical protein
MRKAETILGIIRERGRRKLPLEDIYRQLYRTSISVLTVVSIAITGQ